MQAVKIMVYDQNYTDYQLRRSALRKCVRKFYLRRAASWVTGPTIDFGCGVGELLPYLPSGSIGLEVNPASVAHCRSRGLNVRSYNPTEDAYRLEFISELPVQYRSLVISHVLEHLADPLQTLIAIMAACHNYGIDRIIVIVPGRRGYASDSTHRVFVSPSMLGGIDAQGAGFNLAALRFFPLPWEAAGDVFIYNETHAVYDLVPTFFGCSGTVARSDDQMKAAAD